MLLFPDYQSVWERFDGNLDVDESFLLEGDIVVTPTANKVAAAVATEVTSSDGEPSSPGTENIKKDRTFQAVDAACGGRVFHRFRVNVTPVEFMCKVFGTCTSHSDCQDIRHVYISSYSLIFRIDSRLFIKSTKRRASKRTWQDQSLCSKLCL